jgi:hypothetical protein
MSLKAVHFIFVNALTALCLGCAVWKFRDYRAPGGDARDLAFSIASLVAAAGVVWYGRYFLKKLKNVRFL